MTLDGELGKILAAELYTHIGHEIEVAEYGEQDNVAIECLDCGVVIIDTSEKP